MDVIIGKRDLAAALHAWGTANSIGAPLLHRIEKWQASHRAYREDMGMAKRKDGSTDDPSWAGLLSNPDTLFLRLFEECIYKRQFDDLIMQSRSGGFPAHELLNRTGLLERLEECNQSLQEAADGKLEEKAQEGPRGD